MSVFIIVSCSISDKYIAHFGAMMQTGKAIL